MKSEKFPKLLNNNEFIKHISDIGSFKSELKQLIDDYNYLNHRFPDLDEAEFDWWMIIQTKLQKIYQHVHAEIYNTLGASEVYKTQESNMQDWYISDLYEKIHDRRKLSIKNDEVLNKLYNQVKKIKGISGRE